MEILRLLNCAICGAETLGDPDWFLVRQDYWQDKLRILHWNDRLAAQEGVQCACTAEHMQELVVHWMTTGSLNYPFAELAEDPRQHGLRQRVAGLAGPGSETLGARQIGELAVHRESLQRALNENPQSLRTILDALSVALQQESPGGEPRLGVRQPRNHAFLHEA
jgi:hypothetical protein